MILTLNYLDYLFLFYINMITEVLAQMDRNNIEAYTPKYAVDLILPYINKDMVIWAPFSKDEHNYANYLRELWYNVINTHIDNWQDFLTYNPDFKFDIIIDNPPFKNKTKYVERAISFWKTFALFLPFNSFWDNGIPNLFMKYWLEPQMLIPDKRTEFENQVNKWISFKTVYICNWVLPKQIIFTKITK